MLNGGWPAENNARLFLEGEVSQVSAVLIALLSFITADKVRILIPESGRSVYVTSDDLVEVSWTRPGRKSPQSTTGSIVNLNPSKTSLADSYVLLKTTDGKRELVQLEVIHSIQVLSDPTPKLSKTSTDQDGLREVLSKMKAGQIVKVVWQHPLIDEQFECVGSVSHLDSLDEVGYLFLNMDENCAVVNLSHVVSVEMLDQLSPSTTSKQKSSPGQSVTSSSFGPNSYFAHLPIHGDIGKQVQPDVLRTLVDRLPQSERYPVVLVDLMLGNPTSKKVREVESVVRAMQSDRDVVGIVAMGTTLCGISPDTFDLVLYEQLDQSGSRVYKKTKSSSATRRRFQTWKDAKSADWLLIQTRSLEAALKELGKTGSLKKPGNQSSVSKAMRDAHQRFDDYTKDLPAAVKTWSTIGRRQSEARGLASSAKSQSAATQSGYQRKKELGQKSLNLYSGLIKDLDFIRDTLGLCSYYEDSSPLSITQVTSKGKECQVEATQLRNHLKSGG